MKAGRPSYHIPAKWITVTLPQGIMYFELDKKGNLQNRVVAPHHILDCKTIPPSTQIAQSSIPEPIIMRSPVTQIQTIPPRVSTAIIADDTFLETFADFTDIDIDMDMDIDIDALDFN
jgi:hypothetical protein